MSSLVDALGHVITPAVAIARTPLKYDVSLKQYLVYVGVAQAVSVFCCCLLPSHIQGGDL